MFYPFFQAILSFLGLGSVMMTITASYGICCTLGFDFSPLHNFIPFLLIGLGNEMTVLIFHVHEVQWLKYQKFNFFLRFLGIDDMFVMMQSLYNLGDSVNEDIPKAIASAVGKSGVAITVTSLTDVLAFGVGATTVCPVSVFSTLASKIFARLTSGMQNGHM